MSSHRGKMICLALALAQANYCEKGSRRKQWCSQFINSRNIYWALSIVPGTMPSPSDAMGNRVTFSHRQFTGSILWWVFWEQCDERAQDIHRKGIYSSLGSPERLPGEDVSSAEPPGMSTNYSDEWEFSGYKSSKPRVQTRHNGPVTVSFLVVSPQHLRVVVAISAHSCVFG